MVELAFDPTSRVGKLYADIQSAYIEKGGKKGDLEREVNQGSIISLLYPHHVNDLSKIEKSEVFEFAYRFSDYHTYLAKYGYPLPIGMNDYDSSTNADALVRKEIDGIVDAIVARVNKEGKLNVGSTDYVLRVSKEIYEWLNDWRHTKLVNDCDIEASDWKAFHDECGACTETSAIIHYALSRAGLLPKFQFVARHEATLKSYNRFGSSGEKGDGVEFHVFVSIPMPGRDDLHIDVAQSRYDASYKYSTMISPARFVAGSVKNYIQVAPTKEAWPLSRIDGFLDMCREIDGGNAKYDYLEYLRSMEKRVAGDMGDDELRKRIEKIEFSMGNGLLRENPSAPIVKLHMSLMMALFSDNLGWVFSNMNALERLIPSMRGKISNEEMAQILMGSSAGLMGDADLVETHGISMVGASGTMGAAELTKKLRKLALDQAASAVKYDPNLIYAYGMLCGLSEKLQDFHPALNLFRDLAKTHSGFSLVHYFRAAFSTKIYAMLPTAQGESYYLESMEALRKLETLEPGTVGGRLVRANLALCKKDFSKVIQILNGASDVKIGMIGDDYYHMRINLALIMGDYGAGRKQVEQLYDKNGHSGRLVVFNYLSMFVENAFSIAIAEKRDRKIMVAADHERMRFIEYMIDSVAADPKLRERALPFYLLLYFHNLAHDDRDAYARLRKKMGSPPPSTVSTMADKVILKIVGSYMKKDWADIGSDRYGVVHRLEKISNLLPPVESGAGHCALIIFNAYVKIMEGDRKEARALIGRIGHVAPAASGYFANVLRKLYSEHVKDLKSAPKLKQFLDAAELAFEFVGAPGDRILSIMRGAIEVSGKRCAEHDADPKLRARLKSLLGKIDARMAKGR